jgi:hypothetical protein
MNAWFLKKKKDKAKLLKKQFGILQKYNPLWFIKIENKKLIKELRDWFLNVNAWFVLEVEWIETEKLWPNIVATWEINKSDLIWFDFLICDDNIWQIDIYTNNGIVPLIKKDNQLSKILKEFNPMKNEWNSFFFDSDNKWSIFSSIIKYMENYKFPFDNKCIVKNVLDV